MSMVRCEKCFQAIDSDDDPDCFVEVGNMRRLHDTITLCEPCRDKREDELEAERTTESRALSGLE